MGKGSNLIGKSRLKLRIVANSKYRRKKEEVEEVQCVYWEPGSDSPGPQWFPPSHLSL